MTRAFTVIDAEQRSEQWHQARLGRLTGSRAADAFRKNKDGKWSADRKNYITELVLARLTGKSKETSWKSAEMQQGADREPEAIAAYQELTGTFVEPTGFLRHDQLMIGCSLDGHLGDFEVIIEAKAPIAATHLEYLKSGRVPNDYYAQVRHNLYVSGATRCDWLSFNPDFPEKLRVKLVEVCISAAEMEAYAADVQTFLSLVDTESAALATMADLQAVLSEAVPA